MDSLVNFIATMLSLALIYSMVYNSRRLETIGYALSVVFLQQLIDGYEDVFLICPQFPLYVSPRDREPSPNVTMPDPDAKGVYVDHVLLLPHASRTKGNLKLFKAFIQAQREGNRDLWRSIHITSLEVPLLEEKKRPPTRHPCDLDDHFWSIWSALDAGRSQVTTQAKILFSSPKFATQDLVVLVASSGEYYRLAVLSRGHHALTRLPTTDDIRDILPIPTENNLNDVSRAIREGLVVSGRTTDELKRQRHDEMEREKIAETQRQIEARDARALARTERQKNISGLSILEHELSQIVIDAGDPEIDSDPYSDSWIEAYYDTFKRMYKAANRDWSGHHLCPTLFEPEPPSNETMTTLANRRNPTEDREIVFTGVIRLGSPVSEKFLRIIRRHLSSLGEIERSQRK